MLGRSAINVHTAPQPAITQPCGNNRCTSVHTQRAQTQTPGNLGYCFRICERAKVSICNQQVPPKCWRALTPWQPLPSATQTHKLSFSMPPLNMHAQQSLGRLAQPLTLWSDAQTACQPCWSKAPTHGLQCAIKQQHNIGPQAQECASQPLTHTPSLQKPSNCMPVSDDQPSMCHSVR